MFSTATKETSICLRCQLRALRGKHRSAWTTVLQNRKSSSSATPQFEEPEDEESHIELSERSEYPSQRRPRIRRPYETADLGFERLGEPASVLILKEQEHRKRVRQQRLGHDSDDVGFQGINDLGSNGSEFIKKPLSKWTSSQYLKEVDQHNAPLSQEEVFEGIESFRCPNEEMSLNIEEWRTRRKSLQSGFTEKQLVSYLKHYSKTQPASETIEPSMRLEDIDIIFENSHWRPVQTSFVSPLTSEELRKRLLEKAVQVERLHGKAIQAEKIMQAWGLRLADESLTGEMDLTIHPEHISLLIHPQHRFLEGFAEGLGLKIDVAQSRGFVRVTGNYRNCEDAKEGIHDILRSMQSCPVSLERLDSQISQNLNPETLENYHKRISEKYGVIVVRDSPVSFNIIYPGTDSQALEDALADYSKLLFPPGEGPKTLTWSSTTRKNHKIKPSEMMTTTKRSPISSLEENSVWSRWATPIQHDTNIQQDPDEGVLRRLSEFFYPEGEGAEVDKSKEDFPLHYKYTAVIGRIHHLLPQSDLKPRSIDPNSLTKLPTFISSSIPGMMSFLNTNTTPTREDTPTAFLRLVPSPTIILQQAADSLMPPPIEISLSMAYYNSETDTPFFHRATALLEEKHADVLLPSLGVDIRFTRSKRIDLMDIKPPFSFETFHSQNPLLAWPSQSAPFVPRSLTARLPAWLLQPQAAHQTPLEEYIRKSRENTEDVNARYMFDSIAGAEKLACTYRGLQLKYDDVRDGNEDGDGDDEAHQSNRVLRLMQQRGGDRLYRRDEKADLKTLFQTAWALAVEVSDATEGKRKGRGSEVRPAKKAIRKSHS